MSSSTKIRIVRDPNYSPELATRAHAYAAANRHAIALRPKPGSHKLASFADDLHRALGKRRGVTGIPRNERERWRLGGVWLVAEEIEELILLDADSVNTGRWRLLAEKCMDAGSDLTLVVGGQQLSRAAATFANNWDCQITSVEEAIARWPTPQSSPSLYTDTCTFPRVPTSDFTVFRARCREQLSKDEFELVDKAYVYAFKLAERSLPWPSTLGEPLNEDALAAWLHDLLARVDTADEAVTQIRATQAACRLRGQLLQLDQRRFTLQAQTSLTSLTEGIVDRLRWYQLPRLASVGVLAIVTNLSPTGLIELNIGDVEPDGSLVRTVNGERQVPEFARAPVRAQLINRAASGADDTDALFGGEEISGKHIERVSYKVMQRNYRVLGDEIGLRLIGHWTQRVAKADANWLGRHGLCVKSITVKEARA